MNDRYPGEHRAIRRALAPQVAAGAVSCWRCGRRILPGQPWDLGHDDEDRGRYRGPEHAGCNRKAGGRLGAARRMARRKGRTMLRECVLALEVSEDRGHVSIGAAGRLDGAVCVELAGYLDEVTGAVAAVLGLRAERTVSAVVVDPHSGAANLVKPLTEAGVVVTQPSTSDVVIAHGQFLDLVAAGDLRHVGHPALDAAVRVGAQRRLGGATAWDRRAGGAVDVSPVVACELALWGLLNAPPEVPFLVAWR